MTNDVLAHHSICLLFPGYIEKLSSIIAVKNLETEWGRTHRLVALPDATVVLVAGIFFNVLFNCRETEAIFCSVFDTQDITGRTTFKTKLFGRKRQWDRSLKSGVCLGDIFIPVAKNSIAKQVEY